MSRPTLKGAITLRGDKSLSHRALIFAALAKGRSELRNLSSGADVSSTHRVLQQLGVEISSQGVLTIVEGRGLEGLKSPEGDLDCGNSGTTLRLMLGVLAGSNCTCVLGGDESLNKRPVMRVIEPLRLMGADIAPAEQGDHPPVKLIGRPLYGINYNSPIASAQVKSAVLLAGLKAQGQTVYTEPTKSRDHTERFLMAQGIDLAVEGTRVTLTPGREVQQFLYTVPGDISTAAFYLVAALLAMNSEVLIEGVGLNPTRCGALEILGKMGANLEIENQREVYGEPVGDLVVRSSELTGFDAGGMNVATFIDEVPILAVAAMFASGDTRFANLAELRVKESNRLQGIVDIVKAFGGEARIESDDLIVPGGTPKQIRLPKVHKDHRLAMSVEVLNLLVAGKVSGEYQEVIGISAPEFYGTMRALSQ